MIGLKALSSSEAAGSEASDSSQNWDLEQTDKEHAFTSKVAHAEGLEPKKYLDLFVSAH